jgi:hypothetical protein
MNSFILRGVGNLARNPELVARGEVCHARFWLVGNAAPCGTASPIFVELNNAFTATFNGRLVYLSALVPGCLLWVILAHLFLGWLNRVPNLLMAAWRLL